MMDCGPAALQALVAGFGMSVNYGRLREACQTSVDGTSITTMDEIANSIGLHTEEMMLPVDHLLLPQAHALPAIHAAAGTDRGRDATRGLRGTTAPEYLVAPPPQGESRCWRRSTSRSATPAAPATCCRAATSWSGPAIAC